jgi:hypothetical protein
MLRELEEPLDDARRIRTRASRGLRLAFKPTETLQIRNSRWDIFRATFENPEQKYFFVFRTKALGKITESTQARKENPIFSRRSA